MPTKPKIRTGLERGSPEKGTEIRSLALRGAAGAKTLQCTQVRQGDSECLLCKLLQSLDSFANKWGVRHVPAAAVKRAPQVVLTHIGPKAFVAGLKSRW